MHNIPRYIKAFWGKTGDGYHPLAMHSLDVAACMHALLEVNPAHLQYLVGLLRMDPDRVRDLLVYLTALHDVGKYSDGMQCGGGIGHLSRLAARLQGRKVAAPYSRHEGLGHDRFGFLIWEHAILDHLIRRGKAGDGSDDPYDVHDIMRPLAVAVFGHHGCPVSTAADRIVYRQQFHHTEQDALAFVDATADLVFGKGGALPVVPFEDDFNAALRGVRHASWRVAGLVTQADWLGSNRAWFPFAEPRGLAGYYEGHALPRARRALDDVGLKPASLTQHRGMDLYDVTPRPMQALVDRVKTGPQLFILEDLTGSGKTEAALALANRLLAAGGGVYFALPTQATSDAIYDRVGEIFERFYADDHARLTLAHSGRRAMAAVARLTGKPAPAAGHPWFCYGPAKKAMLGHFCVGTVDQAMSAVLATRHQALRMSALARAVLIVDEVHDCDVYMLSVLESLIRVHAQQGGSVILMSATLSLRQRRRLTAAFQAGRGVEDGARPAERAFPLLTRVDGADVVETAVQPYTSRSLHMQPVHRPGDALNAVVDAARRGQCACWVRNTVTEAREAYEQLRQNAPGVEALLIHSRFTRADRALKEMQIQEWAGPRSTERDRSGKAVIATQVLGQSLDLDFDVMVCDLAPVDEILQRIGRWKRHTRDARGNPRPGQPDTRQGCTLYLHCPDPSAPVTARWYRDFSRGSAFVYPHHDRVWRTQRVLSRPFNVPGDVRDLIEEVYADTPPHPELQHATDVAEATDRSHGVLARFNVLGFDAGYVRDPRTPWSDDIYVPTRLGIPSVRLALIQKTPDGRMRAWAWEHAGNNADAWPLSEVTVYASKVDGEVTSADLDHVKSGMPGKGRHVLGVFLENVGGQWIGTALRDGQPVTVTYSSDLGLQVSRQAP